MHNSPQTKTRFGGTDLDKAGGSLAFMLRHNLGGERERASPFRVRDLLQVFPHSPEDTSNFLRFLSVHRIQVAANGLSLPLGRRPLHLSRLQ